MPSTPAPRTPAARPSCSKSPSRRQAPSADQRQRPSMHWYAACPAVRPRHVLSRPKTTGPPDLLRREKDRVARLRHRYGAIRRPVAIAMAILIASNSGLSAAEPPAADRSPEFRQCVRDSAGVTAAMQTCMAGEYRRLDRALNAAYRDALRRLPSNAARSRLRDLQRTWLKTRWDICADEVARSGMAGGSGGQLVEASCRLRVVSDRTQWLREYPQPMPYGR